MRAVARATEGARAASGGVTSSLPCSASASASLLGWPRASRKLRGRRTEGATRRQLESGGDDGRATVDLGECACGLDVSAPST
ncbi:hypothetical protein OPV22_002931 [Ensete ventricosum]|uniref:Uncharacterized protein n=1 Tax=Ensete ventricosum TaxID=4639 RepID=A0AAV8RZG1_ENSVE|nr:hypothetical protein OPV22_002931 [Ensete ventricosum]